MVLDFAIEIFEVLSFGKGVAEFAQEMGKRIAIVNVPTLNIPGIGNSDHVHL